ncbi:MAG: NUDIX hydrolase [Armatimonadetes bacterium]|nr:NUDIX hydrolase [Armatimonadota bacterium]
MSDHLRETRIDGERVYDGQVVKLEVDRVRLPDGRESVREVVRHPGAVMVVPLTDDGRVVMVRQHRYCTGEALLELPAGTLEPGEEPLACAQRELVEETGYQARDWRHLASFYTTPGFTDELIHCYLASGITLGERAGGDEDELIELAMLPLSSAQTLARRGEIRDAKTMVGLLLTKVDEGR